MDASALMSTSAQLIPLLLLVIVVDRRLIQQLSGRALQEGRGLALELALVGLCIIGEVVALLGLALAVEGTLAKIFIIVVFILVTMILAILNLTLSNALMAGASPNEEHPVVAVVGISVMLLVPLLVLAAIGWILVSIA